MMNKLCFIFMRRPFWQSYPMFSLPPKTQIVNGSVMALSWRSKRHVIVDAAQLRASGAGSGRYAILNCACGSGAGCADLQDDIGVIHEGDRITWEYKAPRIDEQEAQRVFAFYFHKPQYLKELDVLPPA